MFVLLCAFCFLDVVFGNFHTADFVQTSLRGQFQQQRTTWGDLQGRHCPRFNIDSAVTIPVPAPKGFEELDEYKIQLAFDHERLFSSWLTVLAKPDAPGAGFDIFHGHKLSSEVLIPYIRVQLWKRDDELLKIRIEGRRLPEQFMKQHPELIEEYKNRRQWPKHILVVYEWQSLDEADAQRGLMFLIYGGMFFIVLTMFGVLLTSREKISEFFREMAVEGLQMSATSVKEERKAE